jgi:hypothetical protein
MDTFQENKSVQEYNPLNQCRRCGIKPGKFIDKDTQGKVGVFLLTDARGGKTCNLCAKEGYHIGKKKLTKAEKKQFKKLQREMVKIPDIKHITLDAKGNKVE